MGSGACHYSCSEFEDISIRPSGSTPRSIDAEMGNNNPITQVRQDANLVFPDRHVAWIVSIGCGQASTISIPKRGFMERPGYLNISNDVIKAAEKMAKDSEEKHQEAAR